MLHAIPESKFIFNLSVLNKFDQYSIPCFYLIYNKITDLSNMGSYENYQTDSNLHTTDIGNGALEDLDLSYETVIGFNADMLLDEINSVEDLDELDQIYNNVLEEMHVKADLLKSIQRQNEEMKSALNSKKFLGTELDQQHSKEQQNCINLREMIEAKRMELEQLHTQQVEDLEQFENDVQKITEKFRSAPQYLHSTSLMEAVEQLQRDLEDKKAELSQYKQDLQVAEDKLRLTQDNSYLDTSLKIFEESISDINLLNQKLTLSVEQLTSEVNSLRFEMSLLNVPSNLKL